MAIFDTLGRPLQDLRISVTDRCNFRCGYCMPRDVFGPDFAFVERSELLTFEEIARLAGIFAAAGTRKIRLTGGEPLLRRDLQRLVSMLRPVKGVQDIAMTTNGSLLRRAAPALAAAGLDRVTVSLDALDEPTFQAMGDTTVSVEAVLDGIEAALTAGLAVKVNAVVQRGVNEHAVRPLAEFGRAHGITVRFIEYMDVGTTNQWASADVVPGTELLAMLGAEQPVTPTYRGEVARRYRYGEGGEIGIISSVTAPFCGDCTRARLSATGELYLCLFAAGGHDLKGPLRAGASDGELAALVADVWRARDDRYSEERAEGVERPDKVEMSYIGG